MSYTHGYSIGTSLATLVNLESLVTCPVSYRTSGRAPLMGSVKRRVGNGRVRADGFGRVDLIFERMTRAELRAVLSTLFGGLTVSSAPLYAILIDDVGFYTPFKLVLDRPTPPDLLDFTPVVMSRVVFPAHDMIVQSVLIDADHTVTAGERYLRVDTTDEDITLTLPAANSVGVDTPFSVEVIDATNDVIIDPDGSDTLTFPDTLDTLGQRIDFVSDGVSEWSLIVDGS